MKYPCKYCDYKEMTLQMENNYTKYYICPYCLARSPKMKTQEDSKDAVTKNLFCPHQCPSLKEEHIRKSWLGLETTVDIWCKKYRSDLRYFNNSIYVNAKPIF